MLVLFSVRVSVLEKIVLTTYNSAVCLSLCCLSRQKKTRYVGFFVLFCLFARFIQV